MAFVVIIGFKVNYLRARPTQPTIRTSRVEVSLRSIVYVPDHGSHIPADICPKVQDVILASQLNEDVGTPLPRTMTTVHLCFEVVTLLRGCAVWTTSPVAVRQGRSIIYFHGKYRTRHTCSSTTPIRRMVLAWRGD